MQRSSYEEAYTSVQSPMQRREFVAFFITSFVHSTEEPQSQEDTVSVDRAQRCRIIFVDTKISASDVDTIEATMFVALDVRGYAPKHPLPATITYWFRTSRLSKVAEKFPVDVGFAGNIAQLQRGQQ